jgi:hypothetical protein
LGHAEGVSQGPAFHKFDLAVKPSQKFRRRVLPRTALANATITTLRLRLFKVGARVRRTVRKLWFHLASHWPDQDLFLACHHALAGAAPA